MSDLDPNLFSIICKSCSSFVASGRNVVKIKHHHVIDDVTVRQRVTLKEMPEEKKRSFLEEDYLSKCRLNVFVKYSIITLLLTTW